MSIIELFTFEQGSEDWRRARMGIPTASRFATVLAKGRERGENSVTRKKYLYQLAGEIISGEPMETYSNTHMERGRIMEAEARELYSFLHDDLPMTQIGFVKNGPVGCSPDSFVGENGVLEIKTALPDILIDTILKDVFPPEHKAQVQGALWICEKEWADLVVYWPKCPQFKKRAYRDEPYIKDLAAAVDAFNAELFEVVNRIKGYGAPKPPKQHRHWSELSLPEQAGIRCQDEKFWTYLGLCGGFRTPDEAASCVRMICKVASRSELATDDAAAARWIKLNNAYEDSLHSAGAPEGGE